MNQPIVVGVDGSGRSLRALLWAAHDASLRGVPLRLVHVLPRYDYEVPLFPPGHWDDARERGIGVVEEAMSIVRDAYPDLEISSELPSGAPAAVFRAESEHAAVLVLGSKGEDIGNLLLGSVSLQLVGHAASPVVVVGHMTTGHGRVVVGTDGSIDARAALEFGFEEAALRGAYLQVVRAWNPPYEREPQPGQPQPSEVTARYHRELTEEVEPLREKYPDVEVVEELRRQAPAHALARASQRADLLVVGSRGRGGFHGLALGSVAHKVLHLTACPIAVVRAIR